jgi:hypothetical protein
MKTIKKNLPYILAALVVALVLGGLHYVQFKIWRELHPTASGWMYFFK